MYFTKLLVLAETFRFMHGPRQAKTCLRTCTKCAGLDHPMHAQSIIRAFCSPIIQSVVSSDSGREYWSLIGPLRKHAYSNILKISQPNKENFQIKNSDILHISSLNIDCGYSLEPPR